MAKDYKFTFKKGLNDIWSWAPDTIDIKYQKKEVGYISKDRRKDFWEINLRIPASEDALSKNPNCDWMWNTIKDEFSSEKEAREWLNRNRNELIPTLYLFEDNIQL